MNIQQSLIPKKTLQAIGVIQSDIWISLAVFADHATNFNATNETQLRIQAQMQPRDPIPEEVH